MDLLAQGLALSLMGMAITFAALGLLILIIALLQRFFGAEGSARAAVEAQEPAGGELDPEVAAAIAIAVERIRLAERQGAHLGEAFSEGRGPWWHIDKMVVPPNARRARNGSD